MPLLNPNKREEEEQPPSPEEQFIQRTGQKVNGFWQGVREARSRASGFKMPKALKQIGHDIWYGNMGKRSKPSSKPLSAYKWLWDISRRDKRQYAKPYTWGWAMYPRKKRKR